MPRVVIDNDDGRANKHCNDDERKGESGEPSKTRGVVRRKGIVCTRVEAGGEWVEKGVNGR